MRVLLLNDLHDPRIGSSVRQMYRIAEGMRERGHEVAVVSTTPDPAQATPTRIEGCEVHRLHSSYPERFRAWAALSGRMRRPLRELYARWRPDVVHSHLVHTHLGYGALTEARAAGAGVVFTAHDSMSYCYQKLTCFHGGEEHGWQLRDYRASWQKCLPCQRLRYRPGRNAAIRRVLERDVHRVHAVSAELARAMAANGLRVDRVIPNALRVRDELPGPEEAEAFRRRRGLEGARLIAIGGRLHDQKGVRQTFAAVARLRAAHPDLRLLVLGREDSYRAGFEAAARAAGVADRVVPTGWLEGRELDQAYAALDVLLAPSICFETFGMLGLEAMEHSKPVVTSTFGGCPEVIAHGETGFAVNPFDIDALAGAISRLLEDPALARRMGAAGRRRLEERFGMGRLVDSLDTEWMLARSVALEFARRPATDGT